ncbi:MDGA1 [Branchiostoma lanceolatum]|uniref:MDGA1 protein n=1 Tax=Branchiostoma lanceolatum TaxID=7740 RepID=A0A8K0E847_BRALA|nr:MDGA1 [Branchiostoma lanceolatum]
MDVIVWLLVCLFGSFAEANTWLSWFDFYDEKTLIGHNYEAIRGINEEECARRCLVGTSAVPSGSCLSFDFDNQVLRCILSRSTKDTPGAVLADSAPPSRYDYYHRRNAPYGPCDFETDRCQYTQDTADDFDWTRDSGGTPSLFTGPSDDHTTGNSSGYYMYIETSSPRRQGHKARLISPSYRPYPDGQCLMFWTHMYGDHIGTLTVSVKAGGTTTNIWTRSGDQGDQWFSVAVSIPTTGSYQVIFEGIRGGNAHGDIAIDDVSILQGACPDIDECATVSCGSNRKCRNTPGGYDCPCKSGYKEWSGKCRGNLTHNIITRLLNPREFEQLVKGVRRKVKQLYAEGKLTKKEFEDKDILHFLP